MKVEDDAGLNGKGFAQLVQFYRDARNHYIEIITRAVTDEQVSRSMFICCPFEPTYMLAKYREFACI